MIAFSIGNINIYWYGIFYLIGFLFTYFFLRFVGKKKIFVKYRGLQNVLDNGLEDLLIFLILGVIVGGRLGEVFIYQWPYYSTHILQIFAIWNGGMSFFGGLVGTIISVLIFVKIKKISFKEFFILGNLLVLIAPFCIALGRFGNYLNQELYGIIIPNTFISKYINLSNFLQYINIFHIYPSVDNNLRLNTNFLAIIFEGIIPLFVGIFLFIKQYKNKQIKIYLNIGIFVVLYSIARFLLEYFRVGSQNQYIGMFTKSQRLFMGLLLLGLFFVFYGFDKKNDCEL